jgi:argininosuccinate synthase
MTCGSSPHLLRIPVEHEQLSIEFKAGLLIKVATAGQTPLTDPTDIFLTLNVVARKHGVSHIDIVKN